MFGKWKVVLQSLQASWFSSWFWLNYDEAKNTLQPTVLYGVICVNLDLTVNFSMHVNFLLFSSVKLVPEEAKKIASVWKWK